jgi:WD40 repeat protein
MQMVWIGEDRLAVSNHMGLGLYDTRGKLLASDPNNFGVNLSWYPSVNFVRFINRGVHDWYWEKQAVITIKEIGFTVFNGIFDRQGNYIYSGESKNREDYGSGAVYNKHGEKQGQYNLMFRSKYLSLSQDQSKIAFCTNNGLIELFSFLKGKSEQMQSFYASGTVMAAAWSASARYLAVALVHGWLEIWDIVSGQLVGTFDEIHRKGWNRFMHMAFLPRSENILVASYSSNNATHLFDWQQGQILQTNWNAIGFAFSPSGKSIALGFNDGKVVISSMKEYLKGNQ